MVKKLEIKLEEIKITKIEDFEVPDFLREGKPGQLYKGYAIGERNERHFVEFMIVDPKRSVNFTMFYSGTKYGIGFSDNGNHFNGFSDFGFKKVYLIRGIKEIAEENGGKK